MKSKEDIFPASPDAQVKPSRRDFIKKTSMTALTALAAPALLTKYARASERPIKIGVVLPKTGVLAAFTEPEEFVYNGVQKIFANGVTINGMNHPVEFIRKDSQSSSDRAAEVAAELINSDHVDLMLAAHTADTCIPVSDQCEINGVPCCTCDDPVDSWFFGRSGDLEKGFQWTYHFFWDNDQLAAVYMGIWNEQPTNKTVGVLYPDDSDGIATVKAFPPLLRLGGYNIVDPGRFTMLTTDYSRQIAKFKAANAEICTGVLPTPPFSVFWQQAAEQGYKPKICTIAKADLFPAGIKALGSRGLGQTTEVWWSPMHPFKSSLTGQTAAEFAEDWETQTGKEWTQPMGFEHALYEMAWNVLNRSKSLDPGAIRDALRTTDLETIVGPIQFAKKQKFPNVSLTPLVGGQWVHGKKWPYKLAIIFNGTYASIPKTASLQSLA